MALTAADLITVWRPLTLYVAGMAIYVIFIFEFYTVVSRRDVFELDLVESGRNRERQNFVRKWLYTAEYIAVFPALIVVWFLVFAFFIAVLSGGTPINQIMLVSMAVVSVTRVAAYYSEDLAEELAQMLPFGILGIFVVDGFQALSINQIVAVLESIPPQWELIVAYALFTVLLEAALRVHTILRQGTFETVEEGND